MAPTVVQIAPSVLDVVGTCSTVGLAVFTVLLVAVGYFQLRNLVRSNTLQTVLNLERELSERQARLNDLSMNIQREWIAKRRNVELISIMRDGLNAEFDDYLNALDRLAFCILHKYISQRHWEAEYHDLIKETVKAYPKQFGSETYYRNTKALYERWNKESIDSLLEAGDGEGH